MEKLAFTLVTAAHKLKPYFQAHTMIILTDKPLRRAISNPEAAKLLALWAIELSEFDIQYRPRTAIKGQVVADFIAEFTNEEDKGQMSAFNGAYIQTDRLTDGLVEQASCFFPQKETRLNVWFVSTSLPPTMTRSMKH